MTIIDILSRKTRTWQSVDLRDLHPYAEWDEDEGLPAIEITDGFGDPPEIVITNAQLLQKRMDELADQSSW